MDSHVYYQDADVTGDTSFTVAVDIPSGRITNATLTNHKTSE